MMNEELISENNILEYKYRYYLVETASKLELKFGVRIDQYNNGGKIVDSKCVPHIFETREKMIKAIRIMNKLQVTPITLEDVIKDNVYSR